MQQFLRKIRLTFNGQVINPGDQVAAHELVVSFNVAKGISGEANSASIEIHNLSEATRNQLGKELDNVTLEAGYSPPGGGNNIGVIFKGSLRDVEHRREGPMIITKISCGDGDKALRSATTSKTFPAGTPVKDVIDQLQQDLEKYGIDKGEIKLPDDIESKKFKRPYAVCAASRTELNTLGRGKKFYWSIQNETFEVIPSDGYIGGVVLINENTGMIGQPTITDNGVRVACLLNPEIRPNRRVRIESETVEMNAEGGEYRVSTATYSGDNWSGTFRVEIEGEAVKGGKVDEGVKPT